MSECADCGSDLLAVANNHPMPGFVTAILYVGHMMGRQVFICPRCVAEQYRTRQVQVKAHLYR